MKKISAVFLLCSIVSCGAVMAAQKAPEPVTVHYELKLKSEEFGNMGVRKMWIKGNKMRWEAKSANLPLVLLKNKEGVFLMHPWKKVAAKYPDGSSRSNPTSVFPGPAGPVQAFLKNVGAKKHGTGKVAGQQCSIFSYNAPVTKRPVMLWVNDKTGKPAQLTLKGQHGKLDNVTVTYTCYDLNTSVSDKLFQLPGEYKVMPMPKQALTSKTAEKSASNKPG